MSFIKMSTALLLSLSFGEANAASDDDKKHTKEQKHSEGKKSQAPENRSKQKVEAPKSSQKVADKTLPNPNDAKHHSPKPQKPPKIISTSNILMTKQDIAKAVAAADRGKGKIIPFFGFYDKHSIHPNMAPSSGNGFWYLSNYYESQPSYPVAVQINYKGTVYTFKATENAYQAGKCLISGVVTQDADIQKFVTATPNAAKDLANNQFDCGRISGAQMLALMSNLVGQKFAGPLGVKLRTETGLTTLVEGNNWGDSYWGCPFDGTKFPENCSSNLGNTLEKVRANGTNPGAFKIK